MVDGHLREQSRPDGVVYSLRSRDTSRLAMVWPLAGSRTEYYHMQGLLSEIFNALPQFYDHLDVLADKTPGKELSVKIRPAQGPCANPAVVDVVMSSIIATRQTVGVRLGRLGPGRRIPDTVAWLDAEADGRPQHR